MPMAVRKNESTTEIRVNEVVIISKPGASDMIVRSRKICIVTAMSFGLVAAPTPILSEGKGRGSADAMAPAARNSAVRLKINMRLVMCRVVMVPVSIGSIVWQICFAHVSLQ